MQAEVQPSRAGAADAGALSELIQASRPRRQTPRRYASQSDPEDVAAIAAIATEYAASRDSESRQALLDRLAGYCNPEVLPIIDAALADPDAAVRAAAFESLFGYTSPTIVPRIVKGLADPVVEVRRAAMEALSCIEDAAAAGPIALAFRDDDEEVREAAFDCLQELDYNTRLNLLETALRSAPAADVRRNAISELEDLGNHDAMTLIIEGMKDPDATVREEASSAIWFLVSEEFDDYETARRWWQANRRRYDEDLFEKD